MQISNKKQRTRQTDNNKQEKNRQQFQDYNTIKKSDTSITFPDDLFVFGHVFFVATTHENETLEGLMCYVYGRFHFISCDFLQS